MILHPSPSSTAYPQTISLCTHTLTHTHTITRDVRKNRIRRSLPPSLSASTPAPTRPPCDPPRESLVDTTPSRATPSFVYAVVPVCPAPLRWSYPGSPRRGRGARGTQLRRRPVDPVFTVTHTRARTPVPSLAPFLAHPRPVPSYPVQDRAPRPSPAPRRGLAGVCIDGARTHDARRAPPVENGRTKNRTLSYKKRARKLRVLSLCFGLRLPSPVPPYALVSPRARKIHIAPYVATRKRRRDKTIITIIKTIISVPPISPYKTIILYLL